MSVDWTKIASPKCCDQAYKIKLRYVTHYTEDKDYFLKTEPVWYAFDVYEYKSEWQEICEYSHPIGPIDFCPFCGEKLPEIQMKKRKYKKVMTMVDNGYYCDTCDERLMNCQCHPPEIMWEVKK